MKKATEYNATSEPGKYAGNFKDATSYLRNEDLVVLNIEDTQVLYSKSGRTLYDWTDKTQDAGIFTISDVKFVLRQETKNKTTNEEYTGWNRLVSTLETLNEDPNRLYDFSAVIENGVITSVVIIDKAEDSDYDRPESGVSGDGLVEGVSVTGTNAITVIDRYNAGQTVEQMVREWAIARNIKNLEINGNNVSGIRGDSDVFYTMTVVTAYKVAVNYTTSYNNVNLTGPKEVWAATDSSLTVDVTANIKSGMAGSFGATESITANSATATTGSPTHVSTSADGRTATFTFNLRSNASDGNTGKVTVTY